MKPADLRQGRQIAEAFALETLNGSTLLIHRDQKRAIRHFPYRPVETKDLITVAEVARKQDHAAHFRLGQPCPLLPPELRSRQADQQHAARSSRLHCEKGRRASSTLKKRESSLTSRPSQGGRGNSAETAGSSISAITKPSF